MSMKGTCCCCFINNARSLILLLSFFCIISLFANTILLNFAIINKEDLIPKHFVSLSQKTYGLPPSDIPLTRIRRRTNDTEANSAEEGAPVPMEEDEFSTQALISELQNDQLKKKPEMDVDEGYPIPSVDSSIETAFEAATYPPTIKNTRLILLTKATVPGENIVKNDTELSEEIREAAPLIAITTTAATATSKGFAINDKDTVSAIKDGEEKTASNTKEEKLTDYSGVSFFDRSINDEIFDGLFFIAPGIGMLISHIFSSILFRKIGCHRIILVCLLVSAISTAAIPFLFSYGHNAIIGIRVIQGITFGPVFNFIGKNAVAWASLKEQLWFLCTCISALIMTPIISWSLTNEINKESFNLIFYLHAVFTAALFIIFLIFYRDSPQKHRWVNGLELNKVMTGKAQNNRIMEHNVFSTVFKSIPAMAIWIAAFGYFCAFALFITFLPVYAHTVIGLVPYQAGTFAILPFALMAFVHWLSYLLNKWVNVCGLTLKVRFYNTLAFGICAFLFVGLAIAAALHHYNEYSTFVNFVHFAALFSLGFAINGFLQSSIVVGRYYSQYLISHMMIPFSFAFIFVPIITIFFTPLNLLRYWRIVFLMIAVILLLSAIIFAVFGRGTPTTWSESSWDPTSHRMLSSYVPISKNEECGIIHMRTVDDYQKS